MPTCVKCYYALPEGAAYCPKCGKKQPPAEPRPKKDYGYKRSYFTYEGREYVSTGKTQREADKKAAAKKAALESGEVGLSGRMTVTRWADEWVETYKENSVGDSMLYAYKAYLGIITDAIGDKPLRSIRDAELQKILNAQAGKSKSHVTKLRMTMKALFKQARISRLIPYDPAEGLALPASKSGARRSITPKERAAILRLAEKHYAGLWVKTMLYCGLRPGECRALDWRNIDFDEKLIRVEQSMKARTKEIGAPKTASGVRDVPIPDKLYKDFCRLKGKPRSPVFVTPVSKERLDETYMKRQWKNFIRELNIMTGAELKRNKLEMRTIASDLVPYCLRHTYGTDLQDAGVPINVAKYLMGHSDISVTANVYTHTTESAIKSAAEMLGIFYKAKKINK